MAMLQALGAYLHGVAAAGQSSLLRPIYIPGPVRLHYLGGHPGLWHPQPVRVWRVGDSLRLHAAQGKRIYDLPLDRVLGLRWDESGQLLLQFEPTAGLLATLRFRAVKPEARLRQRVVRLLARGA